MHIAAVLDDVVAIVAAGAAVIAARWPDAPEPGQAFRDYVAERITPAVALSKLRIDDLFLAWWAGSGDPRGHAAFEREFGAELRNLASRFERAADDLLQQLRIKLFLGAGDRPPRIREFSGFGSLRSWLKVTAARGFIDAMRADRRAQYEQELDEEVLGIAPAISDARDAHQRAELAAAIKRAFAAAVAELSPRERTFLRHAMVDRLTLEAIASTYRVHRATVARTLAAARQRLLASTRRGVAAALATTADELASALTALDSKLELSLSRVLREPAP